MKKGIVKFVDLNTGEAKVEFKLNPTQKKFWQCDDPYILLSGGLGCVGGETFIDTAEGTVAIENLYRRGQPFYVKDGNGNLSLAMPPVKYEPKQLYRVVTTTGEFVATGNHYVQSNRGKFVSVSSLAHGSLLKSSASLPRSNSVSFQSALLLSALRLTQKVQGFLGGCRRVFRSCGGRLQTATSGGQVSSPSLDDVPLRIPQYWLKGGQQPESVCTHSCQLSCHRSKKGCVCQDGELVEGAASRTSSGVFVRASVSVQLPPLSLSMFCQSAVTGLGSIFRCLLSFVGPYPNPTEVISVSQERIDYYYDFHVVGTHTYQAEGMVHHNSGKSVVMLLKVIYDAVSQDNNYILVGRNTYQEIHDVLLKEFFELIPESWVKEYKKTPHPSVVVHTMAGGTSEIIFRNLDKASGERGKSELLGLNLGGFAIDQAEDVPEETFLTLKGRMRRRNIKHRAYMTSNPKLSWLYRVFKQECPKGHRLLEVSTLENKKNLPESYIEALSQYPESWYKQYVLGIWDESMLSDNVVFAREYIEKLASKTHGPKKETEGVKIYHEWEDGHLYQIGIDVAEGGVSTEESLRQVQADSAVIVVWDCTTDREVACWTARVSPRVTAEKAVRIAEWYKNPLIIPEMNSMGVALLDKLDDLGYNNIYRRKTLDKVHNKTLKQIGWRTTSSSKQLLISHFTELLQKRDPTIYSDQTVSEFKVFVYSNEAKKNGAGAQPGYHDDRIMATLLAAYEEGKVSPGGFSGSSVVAQFKSVVPSLTMKNGRVVPPPIPGVAKQVAKWTTL